jgi:hypothetical protein
MTKIFNSSTARVAIAAAAASIASSALALNPQPLPPRVVQHYSVAVHSAAPHLGCHGHNY